MAEKESHSFQPDDQKWGLTGNLDRLEEGVGGDELEAAEAGADLDLQRSLESVGLNELLHAYGIDDAAADALLTQNDDHQGLLSQNNNLQQEINAQLHSRSLVIIDQSVGNWRELAVSAPSTSEVLILTKRYDGIKQISDHLLQRRLSGYSELDALSIVTSKENDDLQLGSTQLATGELLSYNDELANWREALSIKAKITVFDGVLPETDEAGALNAFQADLVRTAIKNRDLEAVALSTGITSQEGEAAGGTNATAYANATVDHFSVVGGELVNDLNAYSNLQEAVEHTNKILTESPNQTNFDAIVEETFGQAGSDEQQFQARLNEIEVELSQSGLGITVELKSNEELQGAKGVYISASPADGEERIYLNADWINGGASSDEIVQVLLEESGHSIDTRLNGS